MTLSAPRVCVILVNWNGWRDTVECLQSCETLDNESCEIVVIDNGSTDESVERISSLCPGVRLVEVGENLGFAGGNNVGIEYALKVGFDFVWLLNNDTTVAAESLSALVDTAESDEHIAVVGSKIYYSSEPNVIWFAGGVIDRVKGWTLHRGLNEADTGQYDACEETQYVTGASMLVRTAAIREVGMMRTEYFLYWEEVDWCTRIADAGWSIVYQPKSLVWHKVSASAGGDESPSKARYEGRNRVLYYRWNRPSMAAWIVATTLAQSAWAAILGRPRIGMAMAHGVFDGIAGRSGRIR